MVSNATSGSSSTGEQGRTFHLEFACLRVPAAAQCSRGTDRYFKADPARNIRYLTTDMRALLDYFPEIGSLSMGPLTGFRVFLDSSRRISAEWWQCELPDSFTPARVYSYRSSARRPNLATVAMSITELGKQLGLRRDGDRGTLASQVCRTCLPGCTHGGCCTALADILLLTHQSSSLLHSENPPPQRFTRLPARTMRLCRAGS